MSSPDQAGARPVRHCFDLKGALVFGFIGEARLRNTAPWSETSNEVLRFPVTQTVQSFGSCRSWMGELRRGRGLRLWGSYVQAVGQRIVLHRETPTKSRRGALGTRMSLPKRRIGVGHCPTRISSYAAVRPIPRIAAAVSTSTTGGRFRICSTSSEDWPWSSFTPHRGARLVIVGSQR